MCSSTTDIYPVVVYGLEVVLPKPTLVEKLVRVYKKIVKPVLSLPSTVADLAMFIISGAIHKRALIFYVNLCRLEESSLVQLQT